MLRPGDAFERYTIEALIGQGGMGCVYRAYDPRLGRRVALKVISEGSAPAAANARLVREARAAAAFDHPNAVAIFDVGELDGAPYIVMELVEGRTLRRAAGRRGAAGPDPHRAARRASRAPWRPRTKRGLVHRDIKPENVMVRDDGMVKVLDFGIARRTGGSVDPRSATQPALPTLTVEGVKLGTPVYMAPEQIRGDELDGRADQFAWGVLAYELLAGKLPWRGADALAVMASVLTDPVERLGARTSRRVARRGPCRAARPREETRAIASPRWTSCGVRSRPPSEASRRSSRRRARSAVSATMAQQFSTSEVTRGSRSGRSNGRRRNRDPSGSPNVRSGSAVFAYDRELPSFDSRVMPSGFIVPAHPPMMCARRSMRSARCVGSSCRIASITYKLRLLPLDIQTHSWSDRSQPSRATRMSA